MGVIDRRKPTRTFERSKPVYASLLSTSSTKASWPDITLSAASLKYLYRDSLHIRHLNVKDAESEFQMSQHLCNFKINDSAYTIFNNHMKAFIDKRLGEDYVAIVEDHTQQMCTFLSSLTKLRLTTKEERASLIKSADSSDWFKLTAADASIPNFGFNILVRFLAKSSDIMNGCRLNASTIRYLSTYFTSLSDYIDTIFKSNGVDPDDVYE